MKYLLKKIGTTKVLVMPDTQFPHIDHKAMDAVYKFIEDPKTPKFDVFLQVGDLMDYDYCSRWTKGNYRFLEGKRFQKDYDDANKWLDRLEKALYKNNPQIEIFILEGNHDRRPEDVIDANPALEGMIEIENGLRFKERGYTYIRNWESKDPFIIGHANFIHGDKVNAHHAKGMAQDWDVPIFYGHTHDINCHSRTTRVKGKPIVAQSLGCLCRMDLSYVGRKPTNWAHAITTFTFTPDGKFGYTIHRIIDGVIRTEDGRVFEGGA